METQINAIPRLTDALSAQLSPADAGKMAVLIDAALNAENIYTEDLPLSDEDKHDYLLMAFEERILIPVRSHQSTGSWGDRMLRFAPEEMFFMPPVARILFEHARDTAKINSEAAARQAMAHHPAQLVDDAICFLKQMRPHTKSCMAEGGLMAAVAKGAGIKTELHDIVDACVIAGIMNACTRGSSLQGLAWYEIHPCLYWDQQFL